MSNTIGITKDLDSSRTEALQGLVSSLGRHLGDNPSPDGTPLSTEQLQKLSQKINEILGDGVDRSLAPGGKPSQLLNGDGLPIIDISEPVDEAPHTDTSSSLVLDQDLIPLALLPPEERERRRRERDRILDLFEQEECLQQLQEEQIAQEERKEATKKRKEAVKAELEQLNVARELQKKMGKVLVQRAKGMEENRQAEDLPTKSKITSSIGKKSVSFADAPTADASKSGVEAAIYHSTWGDVIPGRLRAKSRIPSVSKTQEQEYPMKMRVVERHPAGTPPSLPYQADSDDESTSSAGRISAHTDDDSSKGDESSSSNSDLSDDGSLEEEFDYDAAQHQREVALEYHKKRHTIGAETAKAMTGSILDDSELYESTNEQPSLSHLRADRMVAAYDKSRGPASASVGEPIVPASRQRSLRNAVRLGRLENDELTGGHSGESGSEDETIREVIQMLQTGNIKNAGPDLNSSSVSTVAPRRTSDALEPPFGGASHAPRGAKPPQPTMSHVVERKAPRSTPSRRFPIHNPLQKSPVKTSGPAPPMIIDSPSFPMTATTSKSTITIPSSSSLLVAPSSDNQVRLNPVPSVKSSVAQDPTIQSLVSPQKPSSIGRPVSKFMTERKK